MENRDPFKTSVASPDDGKTVGIIAYLTPIGWLIAYFAYHKDNKTALGSYQLRQTLLLYITAAVLTFILRILSGILFFSGGYGVMVVLDYVVQIATVVAWVIGFIGALSGDKKPIPLIGEPAQSAFSGI